MRLKPILILFLFFSMKGILHSQILTTGKSGKEHHLDFYNSMGIGYGFRSVIFTDQVNISYDDFVLGLFGETGGRHYIGRRYATPNNTIHQYEFVTEYAVLFGKQFHPQEQNLVVISIGPVWRKIKVREWPDKGSGSIPMFGPMMNHNPAYDRNYWGFRINAEVSHQNLSDHVGIGLGAFFSYTQEGPGAGATLNFLFGVVR